MSELKKIVFGDCYFAATHGIEYLNCKKVNGEAVEVDYIVELDLYKKGEPVYAHQENRGFYCSDKYHNETLIDLGCGLTDRFISLSLEEGAYRDALERRREAYEAALQVLKDAGENPKTFFLKTIDLCPCYGVSVYNKDDVLSFTLYLSDDVAKRGGLVFPNKETVYLSLEQFKLLKSEIFRLKDEGKVLLRGMY